MSSQPPRPRWQPGERYATHQELHSVGLLCGSFRPTAAIAALRAYLRHRETLVQGAATHVQRMQKALVQMNLQLSIVISDITGVTGLRIVRDIIAGQTDPHALAQHRDRRCQASAAEITGALTGHYRPEHVFVLQQEPRARVIWLEPRLTAEISYAEVMLGRLRAPVFRHSPCSVA